MILVLKWIRLSKNGYSLGKLSKEGDEYVFRIDREELKKQLEMDVMV